MLGVNKTDGFFLVLQGAGGGGGEASALNLGAFAGCRGSGGGGGGAFILAYIYLKAIPNVTCTIIKGSGGAMGGPAEDHVCTGRGASGGDGGDSKFIYNETDILIAGGGKGGGGSDNGPIDESEGRGYGGAGGTVSTNTSSTP
jgi:hypothetical protein